jgi:hypothetical protein
MREIRSVISVDVLQPGDQPVWQTLFEGVARALIGAVETWAKEQGLRAAVLAHQGRQPHGPAGSMTRSRRIVASSGT